MTVRIHGLVDENCFDKGEGTGAIQLGKKWVGGVAAFQAG
jgi:hypothetical protein